jgi:hypothetical protein
MESQSERSEQIAPTEVFFYFKKVNSTEAPDAGTGTGQTNPHPKIPQNPSPYFD